jgi:hypothetical protein
MYCLYKNSFTTVTQPVGFNPNGKDFNFSKYYDCSHLLEHVYNRKNMTRREHLHIHNFLKELEDSYRLIEKNITDLQAEIDKSNNLLDSARYQTQINILNENFRKKITEFNDISSVRYGLDLYQLNLR